MIKLKGILKILFIILLLLAPFSCFNDGSIPGPKGCLRVTVTTSSDIWGYPQLKDGSTTEYLAYYGDTLYTWQYPEVGGVSTVDPSDPNYDPEMNISNLTIPYPDNDTGNRINYIYLYSTLGVNSNSEAVKYRGELSSNGTITISNIAAGDYYVVAFYDYSYGGNQQNMLNRYDRYAIYTSTDPAGGTANSTPFQDKASIVTITENSTTEITLDIKRDWVLGKPKVDGGGTGRVFLQSTEQIPTPDGSH